MYFEDSEQWYSAYNETLKNALRFIIDKYETLMDDKPVGKEEQEAYEFVEAFCTDLCKVFEVKRR